MHSSDKWERRRQKGESQTQGLEPAPRWQGAQIFRRRVAERHWTVEHLPLETVSYNGEQEGFISLRKEWEWVSILARNQASNFPESTLQNGSIFSLK